MPNFTHHDLRLLNPTLASPLLDVLTELEHLRRLEMRGSTPGPIFFQLKQVFHLLESLASARIEGNHTTLADLVETKVNTTTGVQPETIREIENIEVAMKLIEEEIKPGEQISELMIRNWHSLTVNNLEREGDKTPGAYRNGPVRIAQAEHLPPPAIQVPGYMEQLVAFINAADPPKYDLMKVALAHHRFGWIHPFGNGNGRVVRLLTYALLIKYGFRVTAGGRLLNPAAVFCSDREQYYSRLAEADLGTDAALENWCIYVLQGVLSELRKVDRLTDYENLKSDVLVPALRYARERELITAQEAAILTIAIRLGRVKASDLDEAMPDVTLPQRTYQIRKLVTNRMLRPVHEGARQYTIAFMNNTLLRGIIQALTDQDFIPKALSNGKTSL
jgi:Fic family protein